MSVYVASMVPVLVEVDLHEEMIVGVNVDDEHADGPAHVFTLDPVGLSDSEKRRAVEVADDESWPAWEFGG